MWIPVYPGARRNATDCYITCDRADQVLSFYRRELPNWSVIVHRDGLAALRLLDPSRRRTIEIEDSHGSTRVTFSDSDGEESN